MINITTPKHCVYRLFVDNKFVGYTNRFEHKYMLDEDRNPIDYFGIYATPALADEGDTVKHSNQVWLSNDHTYKLEKEVIL